MIENVIFHRFYLTETGLLLMSFFTYCISLPQSRDKINARSSSSESSLALDLVALLT